MTGSGDRSALRQGRLKSIGPAIIVGSVVLGPGSILAASRVGCDVGYGLLWVVVGSTALMIGMTALSARLGTALPATIGDELARRIGRPLTAFVGVVLFLVVACFQFSNNIGVIAAVKPLVEESPVWPIVLIMVLNAGVIGAQFGLRRLYRPVERTAKVLVGLMLIGFLGNMVFAGPSLGAILGGLRPRFPAGADLAAVTALIGTTFSVAGAFYQCYLVRQKGWTRKDSDRGSLDSLMGISILGFLTMVVMITAASVLHGKVEGVQLSGAEDVSRELEPLFGPVAKVLFCVGLLAGAFSSFLVNVMIGGTVLSDCLGLGADMDGRWPRRLTIVALLTGMVVALIVQRTGHSPVHLVVFAQGLTVLGNPVLAIVLLGLAMSRDEFGRRAAPLWMRILATIGLGVVIVLAWRTAVRVFF